jgi:hypothetical protein
MKLKFYYQDKVRLYYIIFWDIEKKKTKSTNEKTNDTQNINDLNSKIKFYKFRRIKW